MLFLISQNYRTLTFTTTALDVFQMSVPRQFLLSRKIANIERIVNTKRSISIAFRYAIFIWSGLVLKERAHILKCLLYYLTIDYF